MSDYRDPTPMVFGPPRTKDKREPIVCDHLGTKKTYTVAGGYRCERCGRPIVDEE